MSSSSEEEITETRLRIEDGNVVIDIPDELDRAEELERIGKVTEIMDEEMSDDKSIDLEEVENVNERLDERFN